MARQKLGTESVRVEHGGVTVVQLLLDIPLIGGEIGKKEDLSSETIVFDWNHIAMIRASWHRNSPDV